MQIKNVVHACRSFERSQSGDGVRFLLFLLNFYFLMTPRQNPRTIIKRESINVAFSI